MELPSHIEKKHRTYVFIRQTRRITFSCREETETKEVRHQLTENNLLI